MSRPIPPTYKTKNWPAYNEALKRRGSLTIWFDPTMTWEAAPTGKRGRQPVYSDAAIQACLTMKVLFGLPLRQTTGFVESLLQLAGVDWAVPDFSTLSRRQRTLKVNIPYRGSGGLLHLLIDSTGIKVEGEGEWNARKHGGTKRPSPWFLGPMAKPWLDWRKVHIGIDEETLEIRALEFTTSDVGDAPMLPELLDQIPPEQEIVSVTADGAFDTRKCHRFGGLRGRTAATVPLAPSPRGARPQSYCPARMPGHGNPTPPGHSPATKSCALRSASVEPSGDDGAAITAGAASRPRCTASSCWDSVWPLGTSIVRSPSSRSVWPF